MRFNPFSGSGAGRALRLRLASLTLAVAVAAGVVVAATSVSSAKNKARGSAAAASPYPTKVVDGTLIRGTLPKNGRPARGGTITIGQLNGQTPTGINPIIASAQCSTQTFEFVADQYIPLYYGPTGASPAIDEGLSAALPPRYSNHDTTVTIRIKPGLKWSDGAPVNAEDVAFWYYLTKAATNSSPANWCQYASPTEFPYNVKSLSWHGNVLVMHLTHPVNPNWFTLNQLQDTNGGAYPLPVQAWDVNASGQKLTDWATNPADALAIWNNLNTQGTTLSDFATSPLWKVVDGPFKLKSFNTTNSSYVLVPNPSYGLKPKPTETVDVNTYTSASAQLDAAESGSLDILGLDAGTQLGSIPTLKRDGFSVFGGPSFGWFGGYLNFLDHTDHFNKIIAQPYMRGVFAELVNDPAIIQGVYHGWAVPAYGPIAQYPESPYVPPNVTKPYWTYSPAKAAATLKAHGWAVHPGGQTVCAHPGTKPNECGAGIPKGTPIKFVWANVPESVASTGVLESEAWASQAKRVGIDVTFQTKTFNFLTGNYNDQSPNGKKYENDWGVNNYGGVFVNYYPTQDGIMNTTGALNDGYYNDPIANRLMSESIRSPSKMAIEKEIAYFVKSQPIIYFPLQDQILAVSNKVGGTTDGFLEMTQQQVNPALLWVNKR